MDIYLVALFWRMICNLRDPMSLRHAVFNQIRLTYRIHCLHSYSRHNSHVCNEIRVIICTLIDDKIHMYVTKYVWYAASIRVAWHVYLSHVARANALYPRRNESCYIYDWVTPHTLKAANLGNCDLWLNAPRHTYECITSHIWMHHVTHMNASRDT